MVSLYRKEKTESESALYWWWAGNGPMRSHLTIYSKLLKQVVRLHTVLVVDQKRELLLI